MSFISGLKKSIILSCAGVLAFAGVANMNMITAFATPSAAKATKDEVRVRESAVTGNMVGSLSKDQEVKVLDEKEAEDGMVWYEVTYETNGQERHGWVRSDMVEATEGESGESGAEVTEDGIAISTAAGTVTLMDIPGDALTGVSDRYASTSCTVDSASVTALQLSAGDEMVAEGANVSDIYYVYGTNESGAAGWYVYDASMQTLQQNIDNLYMATTAPEPEEEETGLAFGSYDVDSLTKMIVGGLGIVCILLLILTIVFGARYRGLRKYLESDMDEEEDIQEPEEIEEPEEDEEEPVKERRSRKEKKERKKAARKERRAQLEEEPEPELPEQTEEEPVLENAEELERETAQQEQRRRERLARKKELVNQKDGVEYHTPGGTVNVLDLEFLDDEEPEPEPVVEEVSVEEVPVEEVPVEEVPVEEVPVEEVPVEEVLEEVLVEEVPVEETPVEEIPLEEIPLEETPVDVPEEVSVEEDKPSDLEAALKELESMDAMLGELSAKNEASVEEVEDAISLEELEEPVRVSKLSKKKDPSKELLDLDAILSDGLKLEDWDDDDDLDF